jgi:hypothetical protein
VAELGPLGLLKDPLSIEGTDLRTCTICPTINCGVIRLVLCQTKRPHKVESSDEESAAVLLCQAQVGLRHISEANQFLCLSDWRKEY